MRTAVDELLRFDAPGEDVLYLRLAAGSLQQIGPRHFRFGRLSIRLPNGEPVLRQSAKEGESELLLKLELPRGETSIEVRYEVL